MATTAWKFLGTGATSEGSTQTGRGWDDFGNGDWDATQLGAQDGSYAYHQLTAANHLTDFGVAYNFGFTGSDVPSGATIDGIEVRLQNCNTSNGGRYCLLNSALLTTNAGSSTTGSDTKDATPFADGDAQDLVCGGPSSTWGASISQSDVVSSNFGVVVQFIRSNGDDGNSTGCRIDSVEMRIHYTASGTSASGDVEVAAATADGAAAVERDASGAVSITAATADGAASVERDASGAVTTPAATADGSAAVSGATNASGAVSIAATTADGAAAREVDASGAVSTGAATADGTAAREVDASGAISAPAATADGSATVAAGPTAAGAVITPAATASGTAVVTRKASGAVSIGAVTASGGAARAADATGAVSIPSVTADGTVLLGDSSARIATAAQSRNRTVLANNGRNSTTLS